MTTIQQSPSTDRAFAVDFHGKKVYLDHIPEHDREYVARMIGFDYSKTKAKVAVITEPKKTPAKPKKATKKAEPEGPTLQEKLEQFKTEWKLGAELELSMIPADPLQASSSFTIAMPLNEDDDEPEEHVIAAGASWEDILTIIAEFYSAQEELGEITFDGFEYVDDDDNGPIFNVKLA